MKFLYTNMSRSIAKGGKNTVSSTSEMACKAVCKTTIEKNYQKAADKLSLSFSGIGAAKHMCGMFFGNRRTTRGRG